MSRLDEDRILHGLYYYQESIDEEFAVTDDQVLWLAAHSFEEGSAWHANGHIQAFDSSVISDEIRHKLLTSKCELPLRYLHHRRLIKLTQTSAEIKSIIVTFAGADRAIRLHTRLGRMDVWYRERKDGFLGLVTTIAVSLITALATVLAAEHLYKIFAQQTRIIYEIEPKAAPGP